MMNRAKKRILMVAYTQYISDARPRREAESLASRGDEVDFIALNEPDRPLVETIEGVRLFRLRMGRYRGGSGISYVFQYCKFFIIAFLKVVTLFVRQKYNIIYVHTMPDFMVFTALIPKIFGAKVILDIHDTMPELFATKFKVGQGHWLIRFLTFQEVLSARFADRVVVTHDLHREIFVRHGISDKKIFTSINYADPRRFFPQTKTRNDSRYILIYHGTIVERLGLDLALRAVDAVRERIPHLQLHIIGDGDLLPSLIKLSNDLGLNDHVYFSKKMLPLEQIPMLIAQADVGIVPNRVDEATDNMMPVKLLEYVAMQKPVIAARTRVVDHYFGDGIVKTFTAEHVKEFADCILFLFEHPVECEHMVIKMRAFNKRHNWQSHKELFFAFIDSVVS